MMKMRCRRRRTLFTKKSVIFGRKPITWWLVSFRNIKVQHMNNEHITWERYWHKCKHKMKQNCNYRAISSDCYFGLQVLNDRNAMKCRSSWGWRWYWYVTAELLEWLIQKQWLDNEEHGECVLPPSSVDPPSTSSGSRQVNTGAAGSSTDRASGRSQEVNIQTVDEVSGHTIRMETATGRVYSSHLHAPLGWLVNKTKTMYHVFIVHYYVDEWQSIWKNEMQWRPLAQSFDFWLIMVLPNRFYDSRF